MLRKWVLAVALVLAAESAWAQPAPSADERFTLDDVLRAIPRDHPRTASSRSLVRAADSDIRAVSRWSNPQLGAVYMRSFGFTTFDPQIGVAQLGVTQTIETAGLPGRRRRVAEYEREAARYDLAGVERTVASEVAGAYFELAEASQRREVLQRSLRLTQQLAELVGQRVRAGAAADHERARVAIGVAASQARLGDAEADVDRARGAFEAALGRSDDRFQGVPDLSESATEIPTLAMLLDELAERRPDLSALRARSQSATARVAVARGEPMPGFALYGGLLAGQGYGPQGERQWDFMVGVTVPLPVVNDGRDATRAAEARAVAASEDVAASVMAARREVSAAWREVGRRRETLRGFRATAGEGERLVAEITAAYREGRVALQALIDAEEAVREQQLRTLELTRDARQAELRLWTLVGRSPDGAPPRP